MRNPERSPERQTIARKESLPITILRLDVDRDDSVVQAVRQVLAERGHVDVLVNNAGILAFGAVEDLPLDVFRQAMETNYFGALRCIQAVLPSMRERRSGPFDLDVAIDSEPEAGAHPLIVVSHGTGGGHPPPLTTRTSFFPAPLLCSGPPPTPRTPHEPRAHG